MNNNYIDELFHDDNDINQLASSVIEVFPMSDSDNIEDFLFNPHPNCPDIIPILPMTGNVLFPGTITPINVTRTMSLRLLRDVAETETFIGVVAQRVESADNPTREDLYDVGCIAHVVKVIEMPNNEVVGILRGLACFTLGNIVKTRPYLYGQQSPFTNADSGQPLTKEDRESAKILVRKYSSFLKSVNPNDITIKTLREIRGQRMLINFIASHIDIDVTSKQKLLEMGGTK